jgi:hypothetical protein
MCKRHWRSVHYPDQAAAKAALLKKKNQNDVPPPPQGESVYENILPSSIAYRPTASSLASAAAINNQTIQSQQVGVGSISVKTISNNPSGKAALQQKGTPAVVGTTNATTTTTTNDGSEGKNTGSKKKTTKTGTIEGAPELPAAASRSTSTTSSSMSGNSNPDGISGGTLISTAMPLVTFLRDGAIRKDVGWHRQTERRARGLFPATSLSSQLESWEKQLALVEILLLSGGTPYANFKDLAHAWGREKGFHHVLSANVCRRRGEVTRKRRSDAGNNIPNNNITDNNGNTITTANTIAGERLNKKAKRSSSSNSSSSNNQLQQIAPQKQQQPAMSFEQQIQQQQQQQAMIFVPQPVPVMTSKGVVVPIVLPYPQHQQPQHIAIQHYPPHPPLQQIQPQHPVVATAVATAVAAPAPGTTTKNMTGLVPIAAANIGPYSDIIHQEELQAATKAAAAAQTTKAAADAAVSKAVSSILLKETDRAKIAGSTTNGAYNATDIANNATTTTDTTEHVLYL